MTATRHVTATFIGMDGSMSYARGVQYALDLSIDGPSGYPVVLLRAERVDAPRVRMSLCPYSSRGAFLANWRIDEGAI